MPSIFRPAGSRLFSPPVSKTPDIWDAPSLAWYQMVATLAQEKGSLGPGLDPAWTHSLEAVAHWEQSPPTQLHYSQEFYKVGILAQQSGHSVERGSSYEAHAFYFGSSLVKKQKLLWQQPVSRPDLTSVTVVTLTSIIKPTSPWENSGGGVCKRFFI